MRHNKYPTKTFHLYQQGTRFQSCHHRACSTEKGITSVEKIRNSCGKFVSPYKVGIVQLIHEISVASLVGTFEDRHNGYLLFDTSPDFLLDGLLRLLGHCCSILDSMRGLDFRKLLSK